MTSTAPDADAVPVDTGPAVLEPCRTRPTFHLSREVVCFGAGVLTTLAIIWAIRELTSRKRD